MGMGLKPDPFVIANGVGRDPGAFRQISDLHATLFSSTLLTLGL